MSAEFKMFIMACLRKNPENRIGLKDMAKHLWVKKFMNNN